MRYGFRKYSPDNDINGEPTIFVFRQLYFIVVLASGHPIFFKFLFLWGGGMLTHVGNLVNFWPKIDYFVSESWLNTTKFMRHSSFFARLDLYLL